MPIPRDRVPPLHPKDDRRAPDGAPTDESRPAPAPAGGEPLVWPPPEHEIDDLEVIELEPFSTRPAEPPPVAETAPDSAPADRPAPVVEAVAASLPVPVVPAPSRREDTRSTASVIDPVDLSSDSRDDDAFDRLRPDPVRVPHAGTAERRAEAAKPAPAPVLPTDASVSARAVARGAAAPGPAPAAAPASAAPAAAVTAPPAPAPAPARAPGAPLPTRTPSSPPRAEVVGAARRPVSPPPSPARVAGGLSPLQRGLAALLVVAAFAAGHGVARWAAPATTVAGPTDAILDVHSTPSGARVFLDGTLLGQSPVRVRVAPGRHVLEVQGEKARRRVVVEARAGVELAWSFELAPAALAR